MLASATPSHGYRGLTAGPSASPTSLARMASQATGHLGATSPLFSWAADCGAHSHSNSCPVRQCALAAPRVRWSAARIAATKAAQKANRRKQSSTQASSSQQSQPSTTATYPEPETEKERSPLDYPQVYLWVIVVHVSSCMGFAALIDCRTT